jgi:hypothetical protein
MREARGRWIPCPRLAAALLVAVVVPVPSPARQLPVDIDRVRVELRTSTAGKARGNTYLRVSFRATVNERVPPQMAVHLAGRVWVGDEVGGDDVDALERLAGLEPGRSREMTVPLFLEDGLGGRPDYAELAFRWVRAGQEPGLPLGEFCWTGGGRAQPGPCE